MFVEGAGGWVSLRPRDHAVVTQPRQPFVELPTPSKTPERSGAELLEV